MVLSCVLPRPAFLLPIRLSPDTTDLVKPNSEFYEALAFDFFSIIIGGISRARPPISATPPNSHTSPAMMAMGARMAAVISKGAKPT